MKFTLKQNILPVGTLFIFVMNLLAGCGERRNLPVTLATPIVEVSISELSLTPTSLVQETYPRDILFFQLGSTLAYLDDTEITPLNVYTLTGDAYVSSDGIKIITRQQEGLIFHNLKTNEITRVPQPQAWGGYWWDGDWRLEGRYFAFNLPVGEWKDPEDSNKIINSDFSTIYIADIDTNSYTQISSGRIGEGQPRWSPDGQYLAYISGNNVYLKSTTCLSDLPICENIEATNLTHMKNNGYIKNLAWSPIGYELGYMQYDLKTGKTDIFTVDFNGNIRNITNTPDTSEHYFDWSPDGNRIAYQRYGVLSNEDLCILTLSDQSIECLSNVSAGTESILWSPDGTKVAVENHTVDQVWELVIYYPIDKTTERYHVADLGFLISWATITEPINN
jgi:dipeptidyl aminopeptidase/acylaminoacyl peptidase